MWTYGALPSLVAGHGEVAKLTEQVVEQFEGNKQGSTLFIPVLIAVILVLSVILLMNIKIKPKTQDRTVQTMHASATRPKVFTTRYGDCAHAKAECKALLSSTSTRQWRWCKLCGGDGEDTRHLE